MIENFVNLKIRIVALFYGIVCHGFFILAGSLMFFSLYFGMSFKLSNFNFQYPILINLLLLIQFPFFHSFLLSKKGKFILRGFYSKTFENKLDTTIYASIASVQLFLLFFLWQPSGVTILKLNGILFYFFSSIYLIGWILLSLSSFQAGYKVQTGSLGWTTIFFGKKLVFPDLPITGLFKIVRHPIYFSFCIILWASPFFTLDKIIIASFYSFYCFFAPLFKEKRLKEIYGNEFIKYKKNTPYFFPKFSKFFN